MEDVSLREKLDPAAETAVLGRTILAEKCWLCDWSQAGWMGGTRA